MAIKLHPDARERIVVYLRADEAIAAANGPDVLDRLAAGDATGLVVPADAAKFTVHPLTASALAQAQRDAGDLPYEAVQAAKAVEAAVKAHLAEHPGDAVEDARARAMAEQGVGVEQWGAIQAWSEARALALCSLGLVECDAFPGVELVRVGGHLRFPAALLERLPMDARMELAGYVERVTGIGDEGKASAR